MPSLRVLTIGSAVLAIGLIFIVILLLPPRNTPEQRNPHTKPDRPNPRQVARQPGSAPLPPIKGEEDTGEDGVQVPWSEIDRPSLISPARNPELAARIPRMPHLVPVEWPTLHFNAPPPNHVPPHPARLDYIRMTDDSEEDLRRQLEAAPEVGLYKTFTEAQARALEASTRLGRLTPETIPPRFVGRPDLDGLPMLRGAWCKLAPSAATELETNSRLVRSVIRSSVVGGDPDVRTLSTMMNQQLADLRWTRPATIPTLQQMLMGEDGPTRELLIRRLSRIDGPWASMALAQRAITDHDPRLRELALRELRTRPPEGYLGVFQTGLTYPWLPIAQHSAEALRALRRTESVPGLLKLLEGPSPEAPYTKPNSKGQFLREMVRINHHRNCLLCHAISTSPTEPVRGRIPTTDKPFPPAYYESNDGVFVRADVTYLRQDFSLQIEVKESEPWPSKQRFDFITRERPARKDESAPMPHLTTPHQKAILFALTALTGKEHETAEQWRQTYLDQPLKPQEHAKGLITARAVVPVADKLLALDGGAPVRLTAEGTWQRVFADDTLPPLIHLAAESDGSLLATTQNPPRVLRITQEGVVKPFASKGLHAPQRVISDGAGGAYVVDAPVEGKSTGGAVCHIPATGPLVRLSVSLKRPGAIALSQDGTQLFLASLAGHDLFTFPVSAPGKLGDGQRILRSYREGKGQIVGLATTSDGHLCLTDSTSHELEIINIAGARVAKATLPAAPVGVAVQGSNAYVLTHTGVIKVGLAYTPLVGLTAAK